MPANNKHYSRPQVSMVAKPMDTENRLYYAILHQELDHPWGGGCGPGTNPQWIPKG